MSIGAELANSQFKKFRRFNGGSLTRLTSPLGTPVLERGKVRMGGNVGKDVSARKKKNKGEVECLLAAGTRDRLSVNA